MFIAPIDRSAVSRGGARGVRAIVPALLVAPFLVGCSTLPFAPSSGPGASLTLATVADVSERDATLERLVAERLETEIAAAHAEDERRIEALEARNAEQAETIAALEAQAQLASEQRVQLASLLAEALDGLAAGTEEVRRVTLRLDEEIRRLPSEALLQLGLAIEAHLLGANAALAADRSGVPSAPLPVPPPTTSMPARVDALPSPARAAAPPSVVRPASQIVAPPTVPRPASQDVAPPR